MIKKTAAVLAFALAAVMPAAPAGAWDRVCVKLPLWKTWFAGQVKIVYGFPEQYGIPGKFHQSVQRIAGGEYLPGGLGGDESVRARGYVSTDTISVNQTKCADISGIPRNEAFIVYMEPTVGSAVALCETHPSNPDKWYRQTSRPYATLNYESWGGVGHPKCRFTHES